MKIKLFNTSSFLLSVLVLLFIISCTNTGNPEVAQDESNSVVSEVQHPEWIKSSVMYEVNIRQYTPEGTFNAFAEHLPRLKTLGVEILWLMPVHPIGLKNRKGSLGSYYSVKDYKGINPEFGTMEDFKKLVQETHNQGMYLIIDWVPNHSSWDNPLITSNPDWYAKDSTGNMYSPYDWTDVVQFDFQQQGLRDYMTSTLKWWLTETGLDGFRFDVAHHIPVDYWNALRPELQEIKNDVLLLAEAEDRKLHEKAFDITYAWEFHHIMNSVAKQEKSVADIINYLNKAEKEYHKNDIRMYFTSNHDENSWNGTVWERMGDAAEVMAVLTYGLPGMPLIYSGQEAGLDHRLLFFEKDEINWKEHQFKKLYTDLNNFKKQNKALWNPGFGGDFNILPNNNSSKVLSFTRAKDDNMIIFLMNLSDSPQEVRLEAIPELDSYKEFPSKQTVKELSVEFTLEAWEYKIYYQ